MKYIFCFLSFITIINAQNVDNVIIRNDSAGTGNICIIKEYGKRELVFYNVEIGDSSFTYNYRNITTNIEHSLKDVVYIKRSGYYIYKNIALMDLEVMNKIDNIASIEQSISQISRDFHVLYLIEIGLLVLSIVLSL